MKNILFLILLMLLVSGCASVKNIETEEELYGDLAKDSCKCVNKSMKGVSPEMLAVIEESNGNKEKLQHLMEAYAKKDPEKALRDARDLNDKGVMRSLTSCMDKLKVKYNDVYQNTSEREVQKNLLHALRTSDGCKLAYVFLKIGMSQ